MKWLFAILVALNIIVFGSMVAGKLIRSPQPVAAVVSQPSLAVEPATPAVVAASAAVPVITVGPVASAPKARTKPEPKTETRLKSPADTINKTIRSEPAAVSVANCSASTVLPEDDYHRIKGLLNRWPHAASRFVEQNQTPAKTASTRVRYMVGIDGGADMRTRLKEQGFDSAISNGRISLGVFNRRSDAEALLARAKINGFSQTQIVQLGGGEGGDTPQLSVAKMRVTFIQVDDRAAREITQVIQRYGRLQRGACKK